LQADIQKKQVQLDEAKNRHYLLRSEVSTEVAIGCQLNTPIKKLAVQIDGSVIEREVASQQGDPLASTKADKSMVIIVDLGGLSFFVDLATNNIFRAVYQPADDFSKNTVSDIRQVVITKVGTKLDNVRECRKSLLIFDSCSYTTYEENLLSFDGIKIWVNDMLVYERANLRSKLDQKFMTLKLYDVQRSDAWVRLMQRDDCQVVQ
jgi:hypothetical protein